MRSKRILLFIVITFWGAHWLKAQVNYQQLNQYIAKCRVDFGVTGMAVGIVKDGDVIFQNGYGLEDAENPSSKVTTYSAFTIASVSKAFTATAISKLVNEGKLYWDDKVATILPYFKLNDPVITNLLTVEDLLSHRSGLNTFDGDLLWYGTNYTAEEILKRIAARPLENEFRASYGYQNIMFIAAAEIIEKVSGKSWGDYISESFLSPLGMIETITSLNDLKPKSRLAYPHLSGKKIPTLNYDNAWGAVGLTTTITDMTIWMRFLLAEGMHQEKQIVEKEVITETFQPKNYLKLGGLDRLLGNHFKAYGLGWFLMDYAGKKVAFHGGGLPGYITQIALVPEENFGVIILTNDMGLVSYAVLYKILDDFFKGKEKKENWAEKFLSFQQSSQKADADYLEKLNAQQIKKPQHGAPFEAFAGTYKDEMYGNATITQNKKKLILTLNPAKEIFTAELQPWFNNAFKIKFNDPFLPAGLVNFEAENNKVVGFTIDLPNPDFHFYKLRFLKQ